jgi:chromosome segregation protein
MFKVTFDQIRENFRHLFTEVFEGGKADLVLVDEEDMLNSGIEIVARPPGKKLQSISLLSGGEQTMTAVSLMFSIYQVSPSPFCVLDELDAPLDESNINRFIRVLKRFINHSQFLVITHNKRTISMADTLYGVTMQEQGVSKIVSARFQKSEREEDAAGARETKPVKSRGQASKSSKSLKVKKESTEKGDDEDNVISMGK